MSYGPAAAPMEIPVLDENGDSTLFSVSNEQLAMNVLATGCLGNMDILTLAFTNQVWQKFYTGKLTSTGITVTDDKGYSVVGG